MWSYDWFLTPGWHTTAANVGAWPFSVGRLVEVSSFLGIVHWPVDAGDLGVVSISCKSSTSGERLALEKAVPTVQRVGRSVPVSAVSVEPGIDILRSVLRFLGLLPGSLGRFVHCGTGADHCRLRHVGAGEIWPWLEELLTLSSWTSSLWLFCNPRLALHWLGSYSLRYCSDSDRFAMRKPCWKLPDRGHVGALLTSGVEGFVDVVAAAGVSGGRKGGGRGGEDREGREDVVVGREWGSPRKPSVLGFTVLGDSRLLPSRKWDGRDCFQSGTQGQVMIGGGACHCTDVGIFHGLEWDSLTLVVCTVPRRSFREFFPVAWASVETLGFSWSRSVVMRNIGFSLSQDGFFRMFGFFLRRILHRFESGFFRSRAAGGRVKPSRHTPKKFQKRKR